ncbi:MAG: DUF6782 family putative metallopeptidase [Pseudomonadota bacterium]
MGFTGIDYSHLKTSLHFQRQRNKDRVLKLRRFTDQGNWQNPGNTPSDIGPDGLIAGNLPYIDQMPPEQAKAIAAIRDKIGQSRLGNQLLIIADQGQVQMGFELGGEGSGYEAAYYPTIRDVMINGDGSLLEAKSSRDFVARAALYTAHELGHVVQDYAIGESGILDQLDVTTNVRDRLLAVRHMEAAAVACSIQVAWDVKEAGDDSLWKIALHTPGERSAALAFGRLAVNDPEAAKDGRARRLAHDDWFHDVARMNDYDEGTLDQFQAGLKVLAAQQQAGFPDPQAAETAKHAGKMMIGTSAFLDYTAMPDGVEHMRVGGDANFRDSQYRPLPNKRLAEKMIRLEAIAEKLRDNVPVHEADFAQVAGVDAKYDDTEYAKPKPRDSDNGHPIAVSTLSSWRHNRASHAPTPTPTPGGR